MERKATHSLRAQELSGGLARVRVLGRVTRVCAMPGCHPIVVPAHFLPTTHNKLLL